MTELLTI